ncbi:MAG: TM2 domain-containing protein [Cyanobacteria bacterium P01_F01_bin.116]
MNETEKLPNAADKKVQKAYIFWLLFFLGISGAHRFYLGRRFSGTLYLLTFGFFGIGQIVDLFLLPSLVEGTAEKEKPTNEKSYEQQLQSEEQKQQLLELAESDEQPQTLEPQTEVEHQPVKPVEQTNTAKVSQIDVHPLAPQSLDIKKQISTPRPKDHSQPPTPLLEEAIQTLSPQLKAQYDFTQNLSDRGNLELDIEGHNQAERIARKVVSDIQKKQQVKQPESPFLGIYFAEIKKDA